MTDLKAAAKAAFDHSPNLKQVYVTSNGVAFIQETDARLHAKELKLEDKTVTPFTRDQANNLETPEDPEILIGKIEGAKTIAELHALLPNEDTRAAVNEAARTKAAELHALEEQDAEKAKTYWWNHIL